MFVFFFLAARFLVPGLRLLKMSEYCAIELRWYNSALMFSLEIMSITTSFSVYDSSVIIIITCA